MVSITHDAAAILVDLVLALDCAHSDLRLLLRRKALLDAAPGALVGRADRCQAPPISAPKTKINHKKCERNCTMVHTTRCHHGRGSKQPQPAIACGTATPR